MYSRILNPERIQIIEPRVAESARLPWVNRHVLINPERVVSTIGAGEYHFREKANHKPSEGVKRCQMPFLNMPQKLRNC